MMVSNLILDQNVAENENMCNRLSDPRLIPHRHISIQSV